MKKFWDQNFGRNLTQEIHEREGGGKLDVEGERVSMDSGREFHIFVMLHVILINNMS